MTIDFEDRLWADLLSNPHAEHALATTQPPAHRLSQLHRAPLTIGGLALLAGTAALVLSLTAASTPVTTAAYAVTSNGDGSVTLTLNELIGVTDANEALARLGVRARIARIEPGCTQTGVIAPMSHEQEEQIVETEEPGEGFSHLRWVIRPDAIPAGDTVQIIAQLANGGNPVASSNGRPIYALGSSTALFHGEAPTCQPPGETYVGN